MSWIRVGGVVSLLVLSAPAVAAPVDARLWGGGVVSNLDAGGEVRLTVDLDRAIRLAVRARGLAVRETYVGGLAEDSGGIAEGLAAASVRLVRFGAADLRLRVGVGTRGAFIDSDRTDTSARVLTELGPMVFWRVSDAWRLRLGWIQLTDIEVSPTTEFAVVGPVIRAGASVRLTPRWSIYSEAEIGGVAGFNGDNEKVQARGVLGVSVALDTDASAADEPPADWTPKSTVGGFVALEWRAFALAGHLSHGPGVSGGVTLFDGKLRLGLMGFGRPGPLNPETFRVTPSGGQTYKGQDQITLRSDGGMFGLLVESELAVPGLENLRVIPGVSLGSAAFGFYLTGEDRQTPDGRRVSEWENELQDGRDAGFAFAIEPGLRLAWRFDKRPVRPYVGARYLVLFDYDAYARSSYDGLSFAGGVEFVF